METKTKERVASTPSTAGASYALVVERIRDVGVSSAELAEIVGVGERQVQHWAAGSSRPSAGTREHLVDLYYVVNQLEEIYKPEGVEIWLHSRNRLFGGQRPIEVLRRGEFGVVINAVESLTHGAM
ncbi:antitoxin Xre/MbcA/ParS toxin-binding domain-containing protein [Candidatus Poriferisodalis sp.]|uniref:antitoxin Xre/MbcA/ParS toxin-binding domain-containing protein n=1 Tax=Candidatus Poriferisodalis sp. TaxID=3101277 RepID=UPI003B01AB6A